MDNIVKSLLNRDKVILHIDVQDHRILHEALTKLGFEGALPENGHGGYSRSTPHEERVNYQPMKRSYPIHLDSGKVTHFGTCYELWNTCYSRVENCPVGEEIAGELLERGLRFAVFDYDYDSPETRALLVEKD